MKDGRIRIVVYYISVHVFIEFWDAWVTTLYVQLQRSYNGLEVQPSRQTCQGELVEENFSRVICRGIPIEMDLSRQDKQSKC